MMDFSFETKPFSYMCNMCCMDEYPCALME